MASGAPHQDPETSEDAHVPDESHDHVGGRADADADPDITDHAVAGHGGGAHSLQVDDDQHHDHDEHDSTGGERDTWVLLPLAVGFLVGVAILVGLGLRSGAVPFL